MKEMSLTEVCKEHGISRRAIQGYEKEGLVVPSGKTNRGYLFYDGKTVKRIVFIRFCQNIGFSLKEIREFIDSPAGVIKDRIRQRIPLLEKEILHIKSLITDAKKVIKYLDQDTKETKICQITKDHPDNKK